MANDSDYGLAHAVWWRDVSIAHRMSQRRIHVGTVRVNYYTKGNLSVPFVSCEQSVNGRDKSTHAVGEYTELKTIWLAL